MGADERQKTLLSNVFFPAAQVSKLQMEEEKGQAVVDVSLEAKSNRYANVSGKRLFVKLNPLKANSENVASVDKRLSPIFLNAVFCDEDDIEVVLPDGYQVESMPKDMEISNQFASFKGTYQKDGDIVYAHYRLIMNEGTFSADQMGELTKTLKAISAAYRQQLVLSVK